MRWSVWLSILWSMVIMVVSYPPPHVIKKLIQPKSIRIRFRIRNPLFRSCPASKDQSGGKRDQNSSKRACRDLRVFVRSGEGEAELVRTFYDEFCCTSSTSLVLVKKKLSSESSSESSESEASSDEASVTPGPPSEQTSLTSGPPSEFATPPGPPPGPAVPNEENLPQPRLAPFECQGGWKLTNGETKCEQELCRRLKDWNQASWAIRDEASNLFLLFQTTCCAPDHSPLKVGNGGQAGENPFVPIIATTEGSILG